MTLRDRYDWIVLGNHPGALLSACLCARMGWSVLVLPLAPGMMPIVSEGGQYLDPEGNYLIGLGKFGDIHGVVSQCLIDLGAGEELESRMVDPIDSVIQVLTPDCRIALDDEENFHAELQRELGGAMARKLELTSVLNRAQIHCLKFWNEMPKTLLTQSSEKRSKGDLLGSPGNSTRLNQLLSALARTVSSQGSASSPWTSTEKTVSSLAKDLGRPSLSEIFLGMSYGITATPTSDLSLFSLVHQLSLSRIGASMRGGLTDYRDLLIHLAKKWGAQVPAEVDCKRIFVDRGRFVGVQISNQGSMISAGAGILGCDSIKAQERMSFSGKKWNREKNHPPKADGWRFTLALTVHKEAIPNGIKARSIWQEKGAPPLEIEVIHPSVSKVEESANRVIHLRTILPFTSESLKSSYQKLIAGRMLRLAMKIMPFLEYHIVQIYPNFRVSGTVGTTLGVLQPENLDNSESLKELEALYGFSSVDQIPHNLRVYSGPGLGFNTGVENLYIASDESYPELGSLGPTLAAFEAVARCTQRTD